LAAAIEQEMNLQTELIQGSGGVFDVVADGELIFSKHKENRFPEHEEILEALRKKV
jgi:selT/selW/selH-like putative selenoprotein